MLIRKHARIIAIIGSAFVVGLIGAALLIIAPRVFVITIAAPTSWVDVESNLVVYLQYTNHDGTLSGQWQEAYINNNQVQSFDTALTGYLNGSQISLSTSLLGFTTTLTGTVNGEAMTLVYPKTGGALATVTLHPGSVDDYNKDVRQLQANADATAIAIANAEATATVIANEQQAVQYENNAVAHDLSQLQYNVNSLPSSSDFSFVLSDYASTWKQEQKDYQQVQTDAANGCGGTNYNYGVVQYDVGVVQYDVGVVQYDDGELTYTINVESNAAKDVNSDIATLQADWQTLQQAVSANTTGIPTANYTQSDITNTVNAAQKQLQTSANALTSAKNQTSTYDAEAKQLYQQARSILNNMHC